MESIYFPHPVEEHPGFSNHFQSHSQKSSFFRTANGKFNWKFWLLIGGLSALVVAGVVAGILFGIVLKSNKTKHNMQPPKDLIPHIPPKANENIPDHALYIWQTGPWGPCGKMCGGSSQTRTVHCWNGHTKVDDSKCNNSGDKPANSRLCNTQPCGTYHWDVVWSECQPNNIQTATVTCVDTSGKTVDDSLCHPSDRPSQLTQHCNHGPTPPTPDLECNYAYFYDDWGTCEGTCPGKGVQTRVAHCQDLSKSDFTSVNLSLCQDQERTQPKCRTQIEQTQRECDLDCHFTYRWVPVTDFGDCSKPCGNGNQTRTIECHRFLDQQDIGIIAEANCDSNKRKEVEWRICNTQPCSQAVEYDTTSYRLYLTTASKSHKVSPGYLLNNLKFAHDVSGSGQHELYVKFGSIYRTQTTSLVRYDHDITIHLSNGKEFGQRVEHDCQLILNRRHCPNVDHLCITSFHCGIENHLRLSSIPSDKAPNSKVYTYTPFYIEYKGKYACISNEYLAFFSHDELNQFQDTYVLAEFQLEAIPTASQ